MALYVMVRPVLYKAFYMFVNKDCLVPTHNFEISVFDNKLMSDWG